MALTEGAPTEGPAMSVTFAPDTAHLPHTYGVYCHAADLLIGQASTYTEGQAIRARHLLICSECFTWGAFTTATPVGHAEAPSPNFSNVNAYRVLDLLGWTVGPEGVPCGQAPADEVARRARQAIAALDDPWSPLRGTDAARRVRAVAEVADYAATHGLAVCWG